MRKTLVAMTVLALIPLIAAGCVSKSKYIQAVETGNKHDARSKALDGENTRLKSDLADADKRNEQLTAARAELERLLVTRSGELGKSIADLRQRVSALESEKTRLERDLAEAQKAREEREEKAREASSTYEQLVDTMKREVAQGQVTISELKGKLTVNMLDAILFDSGKTEVKPEGLVVLSKVVEILKTVKDKSIRIEGHTDAVAIAGALAQKYPTNWELSAARATNVARYLQKQGIDPSNLSSAAFGEFKPVADNSTPEGRAKNRRIEIVLVPKD